MAQRAGVLAADVLRMISAHVKPGITTDELDRLCHDYIVDVLQAIPANVGYHGFPKTLCASVNHVICHGIPNEGKVLKEGERKLSDPAFQMRLTSGFPDDPLRYEKSLLTDWLRTELAVR